MPLGPHDPLTFPGQMQQLGKLSVSLASLTAWRRTAARLGAALAVVVLAAVIALGVAHSL
jgi:hypothetical protein